MDSLKVPEKGLLLQGSPPKDSPAPPQAFAVTLSDNVIEGLLKSVQNGDGIQLALGPSPTLQYGSKSHRLTPPPDSLPYDLFLTKPFESTRTATRIPCVGSLFQPPEKRSSAAKAGSQAAESKHKQTGSGKASGSSEIDSDIETLQKGLAAHEAAREKTHMVSNLPSTKKGAAKARSKILSARSTNGSPSVHPVDSPVSASQQAMDRAKELRATLVHELAVRERSLKDLEASWEGKPEDFRATLDKVADLQQDKTYIMKRAYWKELDVWNYDYETMEDREKAIANAIKQYDKQRLSPSEPEWQRLLRKEERGKGICLSKLQDKIARGPSQAAPKFKLSKADESSTPKDDTDGLSSDKSKNGGESMVRSNSNTLPGKPRKIGSSNVMARPASGTTIKAKAPKPSPGKAKSAPSKSSDGRVLSKAIIENSDSSGDEAPPPSKSKPAPKAAISRTEDTVVVKTKAVDRPIVKALPGKARREEEDSSSSSGTPLARRLTQKTGRPIAPPQKQKAVEPIRETKVIASGASTKNRTTSPTKSSPLASSPPTNASEIDDEETPPPPPLPRKRKAEQEIKAAPAKRHARAVSSEVVRMAQRFKQTYKQYEALHHEVSALEHPPSKKVKDLVYMRDRLDGWKKEIYNQYHSDRESG